MNGTKPLVVVGSSNTDLIVRVAEIPSPGETVIGSGFSEAQGGKGANQAVAAARAGADVTFIACLGRDAFGDRAFESFTHDGIRTDYVKRISGVSSGLAFIFVSDTGENTIAVVSGSNMLLLPPDMEHAAEMIAGASILVTQLEVPLETVEAALRIAREHAVPTVFNPTPARQLSDDILSLADYITPNEHEAEALTGIRVTDETSATAAAKQLRSRGCRTVMITMGSRGVYVLSAVFSGMVPAFPVQAVDTTGAGDVFNGVFAAALAEGRDLFAAVRTGCAAAAISVTREGAQPSIPNREEVAVFLARRTP